LQKTDLNGGHTIMRSIGIGIVGAGYMGKAHSVAMQAVGAVFNTTLRPRLEMIATTSVAGAEEKARALGFARGTHDWRVLVADPKVEAIVIASPQQTHKEIALAAFAAGKPVLCEKPLGVSLAESRIMLAAAMASGVPHMVGFNYIRTPASMLAREIIAAGDLGRMTFFRAEHTEDFLASPDLPSEWRTKELAGGAMGDLAPHIINAAFALAGPIRSLSAEIETVHATRPGPHGPEAVENDDQAQMTCRFENGALGSLFISRIATGRKMGYAYEIYGTKGAIRFDQEDQNALWLYKGDTPADRAGFTKILTGPLHPNYKAFCLGPGHGTGYQDQIIIEARDFLQSIETGVSLWPTFEDGMRVNQVVEAARLSHAERRWIDVNSL
jgi:predicted dehydrogenase